MPFRKKAASILVGQIANPQTESANIPSLLLPPLRRGQILDRANALRFSRRARHLADLLLSLHRRADTFEFNARRGRITNDNRHRPDIHHPIQCALRHGDIFHAVNLDLFGTLGQKSARHDQALGRQFVAGAQTAADGDGDKLNGESKAVTSIESPLAQRSLLLMGGGRFGAHPHKRLGVKLAQAEGEHRK